MSLNSSKKRNSLSQKIKLSLGLVAIFCMVLFAIAQWHQLKTFDWNIRYDFLAIAILGSIVLFMLGGYGWHLTLTAIKTPLAAHQSIRIWLISSITRYLPGGFWGYVSRFTLAKEQGIGAAAAGISLYLETLLLLASSLAVGTITLTSKLIFLSFSTVVCINILAFVLLGLLLHPKILSLLKFLPGKYGRAFLLVNAISFKKLFGLYCYYVFYWLIFGAIFIYFANTFFSVPQTAWPTVGSSMALGFFFGFIIIFFPAGLGIRESVLYLSLLSVLPAPACLAISIASRLWLTLGEVLSLMLILLVSALVRNRSISTNEPR